MTATRPITLSNNTYLATRRLRPRVATNAAGAITVSDPGYMSRKIIKFRTDKFGTGSKDQF